MIDRARLEDVLLHYKQDYVKEHWEDEKYKWEAVQWFQDN